LTVECLDLVFNNATLTPSFTDFTVTAAQGAGVITLRYFPKNGSQYGNATYVFIYFVPYGCTSCQIVNNGEFEFSHSLPNVFNCGSIDPPLLTLSPNVWLDCWEPYLYLNGPGLFATNCNTIQTGYTLGQNTFFMASPPTTLNLGSTANNKCLGFMYSGANVTYYISQNIKNMLNSPLVNGQTYQMSFWAMNVVNTSTSSWGTNYPSNPVVMTAASYTSYAFTPTLNFPTGLNTLNSFTIPAGNTWAQYITTFTYTQTAPAPALIFGINNSLTIPPSTVAPVWTYYVLIDEMSILPIPGPSLTIPTSSVCTNQSIIDLAQYTGTTSGTFSGAGITNSSGQYDFNLTGTLSPGIYPVGFTYSNVAGNCLNTIYTSVEVKNCCSTSTATSFTNSIMSGTSTAWPGPMKFPNSFTIASGCQLYLSGEFLIDAGVKITVSPSSTLHLWGAHLYSCLDLWQGIEVLNGGRVQSVSYNGNENLIEDAEIAMDVSSHTPTVNTILDLSDITFNKNYIGINLHNYTLTSNTYSTPLILNNCLFTCRNFTYNTSSWPAATNLRSATSSTTGLTAPYGLQSAPVTTLKSPHSSVPSHAGINLENAGTTATLLPGYSTFSYNTVYVGPASGGSTSNFLLFDAHETGVKASACNLRVENCVFQNTRELTISNSSTIGAAIQFSADLDNMLLDINGVNTDKGCRFWDCHTAIESRNAYCLTVENAIIRSEHDSGTPSSPTVNLPGDRGLFINTNRFEDYRIEDNEFSNLTDAVSMICTPGNFIGGTGWFEPFVYGGNTYYWIIVYARDVSISNNTISPQTSTTFTGATSKYVRNGITIQAPVNIWSTWSAAGISIQNNTIYRAYNGISINGLNSIGLGYHADGPPKMIAANTITLDEDNTFTITPTLQRGIEFANSIPAPSGYPTYTSQALQSIETNVGKVYGAPLTNTNIALVYCFGNGGVSPTGTVMAAPYIICNDMSDANTAFLFEGPNQLVYWRGNSMTNLGVGMALTSSAVIGPQGTTTAASDNQWLGATWTGTNYATWVDAASTATSSVLYVQLTGNFPPPNNGGLAFSSDLYTWPGNTVSASGSYSCGISQYNQIIVPLPNYDDDPTNNLLYISKMQAYRQLYYSPALKGDDGDAAAIFYNGLTGSSIDIFTQIEDTLAHGGYKDAQTLLGTLHSGSFNAVETNYYTFYNLYINYMDNEDPGFTDNDLETLTELASLCAGTNGIPVYQARALYMIVTGRVFNPPSDCGERGGRAAMEQLAKENSITKTWDVDLFPNPNYGNVTIVSSSEKENLDISICDISGRQVCKKQIQTLKFVYVLDLPLANGAYFMTIKNRSNESVIKKVIVAR
jgi:hypothetical protein